MEQSGEIVPLLLSCYACKAGRAVGNTQSCIHQLIPVMYTAVHFCSETFLYGVGCRFIQPFEADPFKFALRRLHHAEVGHKTFASVIRNHFPG